MPKPSGKPSSKNPPKTQTNHTKRSVSHPRKQNKVDLQINEEELNKVTGGVLHTKKNY
jgi:bacteriocin-like protein